MVQHPKICSLTDTIALQTPNHAGSWSAAAFHPRCNKYGCKPTRTFCLSVLTIIGSDRDWSKVNSLLMRGKTEIHCGSTSDACTLTTGSSYKRVKGRSHTVEKRKAIHPQKPHATSQPSHHRQSYGSLMYCKCSHMINILRAGAVEQLIYCAWCAA